MRAFVISLLLVAACNDGGESPPDAHVCPAPPMAEWCGQPATCGNNKLDRCYKHMNSSSCGWHTTTEPCDGNVGLPSCIDRGFCGGTTRCTSCYSVDDSACTPCP